MRSVACPESTVGAVALTTVSLADGENAWPAHIILGPVLVTKRLAAVGAMRQYSVTRIVGADLLNSRSIRLGVKAATVDENMGIAGESITSALAGEITGLSEAIPGAVPVRSVSIAAGEIDGVILVVWTVGTVGVRTRSTLAGESPWFTWPKTYANSCDPVFVNVQLVGEAVIGT